MLRNVVSYYGEDSLEVGPTPGRRTTSCQLFVIAYSIYSQLPSIHEGLPPECAPRCVDSDRWRA
jgi:hypothetical protein